MRKIWIDQVRFDSKKIEETEDELIVKDVILTRESILPFEDGRGYRSAKELKDAAWTLEGAWLVAYAHIASVFVVDRRDIRGKTENARFSEKINAVLGDFHFAKAFCDAGFLDGVKTGKLKDVSVAYYCEDFPAPGKFGDEPYEFEQRNFMFGHIAVGIPEGRCPSPYCGMSLDELIQKHMDPEETEGFIHIRVRDPDLFVEEMFRTIDIDAEKGIKAVIGKLKSDPDGSTVVQKFIFDKSKDWTMEKAEAWVKEHKDNVNIKKQSLKQKLHDELTIEEIKQKIAELSQKRQVIDKKLWPQPEAPPPLDEETKAKLQAESEVLWAELQAFQKLLEERVSATEPGDSIASVDPYFELQRARRLLSQ